MPDFERTRPWRVRFVYEPAAGKRSADGFDMLRAAVPMNVIQPFTRHSKINEAARFWFSRSVNFGMTMAMIDEKSKQPAPKTAAERRAERLKAELRANLARRKQQARARREGAEDERPGHLLSGNEPKVS